MGTYYWVFWIGHGYRDRMFQVWKIYLGRKCRSSWKPKDRRKLCLVYVNKASFFDNENYGINCWYGNWRKWKWFSSLGAGMLFQWLWGVENVGNKRRRRLAVQRGKGAFRYVRRGYKIPRGEGVRPWWNELQSLWKRGKTVLCTLKKYVESNYNRPVRGAGLVRHNPAKIVFHRKLWCLPRRPYGIRSSSGVEE